MRITLLASGSRGNAILVSSGQTRILVDAGLSAREICRRLECVGIAPDSIAALLITHEHSDHIRGLGPLARRLRLPVYLHTELAGTLKDVGVPSAVHEFDESQELLIGELAVRSFPITHDARCPVGFTVDGPQGKVGIATDLGIATRLVAERLRGCRTLVLESNHDEDLLRDGPYPWKLKQRVRSKHGHLSNRDSAQLLEGLLWDGLDAVLLAHLSETNNCPDLARSVAAEVIAGQNSCSPELLVGRQGVPVEWSKP
ncbi:MAG: MBL fold metallo-hydrolase [Desulfuromonadales bacterium]|nr:MBL fold metallo-hydrolase [Desulfuromonadales bacterium]